MSGPPPRRSSTAIPAVIPPRATTATLLAVGAVADGVEDAERRLAPFLTATTPEARRIVRDALLHLAQHYYEQGQDRRQAVLMDHSIPVRSAYWKAATKAEKYANDSNARPYVAEVIEILREEQSTLPERDVRAILRLFGLGTMD